jgi:hypothetical protein
VCGKEVDESFYDRVILESQSLASPDSADLVVDLLLVVAKHHATTVCKLTQDFDLLVQIVLGKQFVFIELCDLKLEFFDGVLGFFDSLDLDEHGCACPS